MHMLACHGLGLFVSGSRMKSMSSLAAAVAAAGGQHQPQRDTIRSIRRSSFEHSLNGRSACGPHARRGSDTAHVALYQQTMQLEF
jgi:hypothetical protein